MAASHLLWIPHPDAEWDATFAFHCTDGHPGLPLRCAAGSEYPGGLIHHALHDWVEVSAHDHVHICAHGSRTSSQLEGWVTGVPSVTTITQALATELHSLLGEDRDAQARAYHLVPCWSANGLFNSRKVGSAEVNANADGNGFGLINFLAAA